MAGISLTNVELEGSFPTSMTNGWLEYNANIWMVSRGSRHGSGGPGTQPQGQGLDFTQGFCPCVFLLRVEFACGICIWIERVDFSCVRMCGFYVWIVRVDVACEFCVWMCVDFVF